jgi:hypothetical protein
VNEKSQLKTMIAAFKQKSKKFERDRTRETTEKEDEK